MANKIGTLKLSLTYKGPSLENAAPPQMSIPFSYMAQSHGTIDVPGSAMVTTYEIPVGSIDTVVTMVVLQNRTGQEVEIKVNNQNVNTHHHNICSGGVLVLGGPLSPLVYPVTELSCTLSDVQGVDPGEIEYHVFGDSV